MKNSVKSRVLLLFYRILTNFVYYSKIPRSICLSFEGFSFGNYAYDAVTCQGVLLLINVLRSLALFLVLFMEQFLFWCSLGIKAVRILYEKYVQHTYIKVCLLFISLFHVILLFDYFFLLSFSFSLHLCNVVCSGNQKNTVFT